MRNFKIRHIAYFFGFVLLLMAGINFMVVNRLSISPQQTQVIGYTLQIREIAQQLKLTLTILANQDFYNESLSDDIRRLESVYNTRFSVLESGGEIEQNQQKMTIPRPDEQTRVLISKIRSQWNNYNQDVQLVANKLTKDKATDTIRLDTEWVSDKYGLFVDLHDKLTKLYQDRLEEQYTQLTIAFVLLGGFNFFVVLGIYFSVRNLILIPINLISKTSRQLARGNLTEKIDFEAQNEIGHIAQNINDLADILNNATAFSKEIGQGNLDAQYQGNLHTLENKESIAFALQVMRNRLHQITEKDSKDKWQSAGVAEFSEILRQLDNRNLQELCHHVVNFIVKYIEANQGILFVVNDDTPNVSEHYLEPISGYAASKRKIFNQKVQIGEGLVGQCFKDQETIFLEEVPNTYEKISSALGTSTPRNVLLVPFIFDEKALGVIEILSLKVIEEYKITFVERITAIFSSTLSAAKTYNKSQKLFRESLEVEKRIARRGDLQI